MTTFQNGIFKWVSRLTTCNHKIQLAFKNNLCFCSDLSTNKWVTATVETRLEELMNISYNAGEGLEYYWANCDSQLLAPLNTMKAHQELIETEGIQVEQAEAADSDSDSNSDF